MKNYIRLMVGLALTGATYTFGPGDKIVAVCQRPNLPPETLEGHYRLGLEGAKMKVRTASKSGGSREDVLDVGIRDGQLRVGMLGIFSVYRRQ